MARQSRPRSTAHSLFQVTRTTRLQVRLYLQHNDIGDPFQSAYRPSHSVETAIIYI